MIATNTKLKINRNQKFDSILLFSWLFLLMFGLVMVSSASMSVAEKYHVHDLYFTINHFLYLIISIVACFLVTLVPTKFLEKYSFHSVILGLLLLLLVFIPGISKNINGSHRWISLGFVSIQSSEIGKILFIIYLSGYLVRRKNNVKDNIGGIIIPLVLLGIFNVLLLLEPDFGVVFILSCTVLSLFFIADIKLRYLLLLLPIALIVICILIFGSRYRLQRIIGF